MAITIECGECFKRYRVKDERAGSTIRCKACGTTIDVPEGGDVDEDYGQPVAAPAPSRRRRAQQASSSQSRTGLWIAVAAGGSVLLVVIVLILTLRGPAPEPPDVAEGTAEKATGQDGSADTAKPAPAGLPKNWNVSVDPPAELPAFAADHSFQIPVPANSGSNNVVFPATPGPFAAAGSNFNEQCVREVWNLATNQKVGSIRGVVLGANKGALSPDGLYYAAADKARQKVIIFDVKNEKQTGEIPLTDNTTQLHLHFAATSRLVCYRYSQPLQIWSMPSGKPERTLPLPKFAPRESITISPGGKYMTVFSPGAKAPMLQCFDLTTGKVTAELPLPTEEQHATWTCRGAAFSPDGKELAALFRYSSKARLYCWNVADGKKLVEHKFAEDLTGTANAIPIAWFPDRQHWLLFGQFVIDRKIAAPLWSLPDKPFADQQRPVLSNGLIAVFAGEFKKRALESYRLPLDKIAQAAKAVSAGGTEADAGLPPLTPADRSTARAVSLQTATTTWNVKPDPGPQPSGPLMEQPIPLRAGTGAVNRLLLARADAGLAVVSNEGGKGDTNVLLDKYDVARGKSAGSIKIPVQSQLLAISPDGTRVLLRLTDGENRLDVWAAGDGSHVVGWRPYQDDGKNKDRVVAATFTDNDHVLTLSNTRTLCLWELPTCRAAWVIENASQTGTSKSDLVAAQTAMLQSLNRLRQGPTPGTTADRNQRVAVQPALNPGLPAVSPSGKYLAIGNGTSFVFLDTLTADVLGAVRALGTVGAAAFHPQGQQFAATLQRPSGGHFVSWNVADGQVKTEFPIPGLGDEMHWCGENALLLDHCALIDLKHGMIVWKYESADATHAVSTPDGRHWCLVGESAQSASRFLAALSIPGPQVVSRLNEAAPKPECILEPGKRVSLQLKLSANPPDSPDFASDVSKKFTERFKQHSITVAKDQPLTVVLSTASKNTGRTMKFRKLGSAQPGSEAPITEIQIDCAVSITQAGKVVWERKVPYSNHKIGLSRLESGETIEAHLQKRQWEAVKSFFQDFEPPAYVFSESAENGIGTSVLTAQGAR